MDQAFIFANEALKNGEVPIGCVFMYNDKIIASGRNEVNESKNATRHAEMVAIERLYSWCQEESKDVVEVLSNTDLYVTVEPCIMCAAMLCLELPVPIRNIYYGAANERFGGCDSVLNIWETFNDIDRKLPNKYGGIEKDRAIDLLKTFYSQENPNTKELN